MVWDRFLGRETAVCNFLWCLEAWKIIMSLEKMGLIIQLLKWNYNAIYHMTAIYYT